MRLRDGKAVDAACRDRTASWVRAEGESDANVTLCEYFEVCMAAWLGGTACPYVLIVLWLEGVFELLFAWEKVWCTEQRGRFSALG